jgi:hypothetical protein
LGSFCLADLQRRAQLKLTDALSEDHISQLLLLEPSAASIQVVVTPMEARQPFDN